jgi:hypothetical protein
MVTEHDVELVGQDPVALRLGSTIFFVVVPDIAPRLAVYKRIE